MIVSLLVALLLVLPGTAMAATPIQIPWGTGLGKAAVWYRDQFPDIGTGRNVAAFLYERADGTLDGYAIESMGGPHAERLL